MSKIQQLLKPKKDVDELILAVDKSNEDQNRKDYKQFEKGRLDDVIKDFEFFLKAQMEKNRLEKMQSKLSQKELVKNSEKVQAIDQIIKTTRRRLRINPTTKAMKFDKRFKNFKNVDTFLDIKDFLSGMNVLEQMKNICKEDEEEENLKEEQINLDSVPYETERTHKILERAQKTVNSFNTVRIQGLQSQLSDLFNKQTDVLMCEQDDNPDSRFYLKMIKQVNEAEKKQHQEQQYQSERISWHKKAQSSLPLATILENHEIQFHNKAEKVRKLLKDVSEDIFKKKWGNSVVKKNREKRKNIVEYENKKQAEAKIVLEQKLSKQKIQYAGNNNFINQSDQLNSYANLTNSQMRKSSFFRQSESRESITKFSDFLGPLRNSVINPEIQIGSSSPRKKTTKLRKLRLSFPEIGCQPPSIVESFKMQNGKLLQICNNQYKAFKDERQGYIQSLTDAKECLHVGFEQVLLQEEKYRKII